MKPLLSLLFFAFVALHSYAQGDIKVLLVKGKVEKWTGKGKPVTVSNTATLIQKSDSIKLYKDAELLLTADNKALTVKAAGKYSSAKLNKLFEDKSTGEKAASFLNFLSKELKPEHENYQDYAKSHMKEIGSVSRGPSCPAPLMLMPVSGTVTAVDTLEFRWKSRGGKSFNFAIYTLPEDGPPVFQKQLEDTSIILSATKLKMDYGKNYFWQVALIDSPGCDRIPFSRISVEEGNKLEKVMKATKSMFDSEERDISLLLMASMAEQNKMYTDADHAYKLLVNEYPDRDDIRQIYASFLARLGLADEAQAALVKPKKVKK